VINIYETLYLSLHVNSVIFRTAGLCINSYSKKIFQKKLNQTCWLVSHTSVFEICGTVEMRVWVGA
jgi:hypothetical protein